MSNTFQQYGTGIGISLGAGIGATTAVVTGMDSELSIFVGFGVSGGLFVGGFAGQFAESNRLRQNWGVRVGAFTLLVGLLVGGVLGVLAAWMTTNSLSVGYLAGSVAGGAFSLLLSGILLSMGRERQSNEAAVPK